MTAPNRSTLWGEVIVAELAAAGVDTAVIAPGSRSTPLTVALAEHDGIETYTHLDERSAAYFALGRARTTGTPTPLVCTSGTAAANFHPAVIEAFHSRVPLVVLTADRPPELIDSGANQTIDQQDLYGDAVRWFRQLPEPAAEARTLRSLRVTIDRAVATAGGPPAGPVHLNVPAHKPLDPTPVEGAVPDDLAEQAPLAVTGREGPFVETTTGTPTIDGDRLERLVGTIEAAERGIIVTGPANQPTPGRDALAALSDASGFPVFADPLSGHRFGHETAPICGGYDAYLTCDGWPSLDVVLRFGASPTSKSLRKFLRDQADRQVIVDAGGEWPEAEFTASDLVVADPTRVATRLANALDPDAAIDAWRERVMAVETTYWEALGLDDQPLFEGAIAATVAETMPTGGTLMVSNSMPVRDLDRFARPRTTPVSVFGNRGASGIDGITSTAFGLDSATDGPTVLLTGDLAFYHDMNGLLANDRFGLNLTIVLVNNDGGGIFHMLPIEAFDPPFTEQFKTPHGLDFAPTGDLYGLAFERVRSLGGLQTTLATAIDTAGTHVIEVPVDGEASHRLRDRLATTVCETITI